MGIAGPSGPQPLHRMSCCCVGMARLAVECGVCKEDGTRAYAPAAHGGLVMAGGVLGTSGFAG